MQLIKIQVKRKSDNEIIDWNIEKVKLGNIIDAIAAANKNIENFNFEMPKLDEPIELQTAQP